MSSFISKNVKWILKKFDEENIAYAILRNYEILPEIGHDLDMVCRKDDLKKVREILKNAKNKFLWNNIIEAKLWESYIDDYTITVYKMFDFNKGICLQLDFFGGYSIWSAPAISIESLLQRREKCGFYYRISKIDEILIRSMQLACAIRDKEVEREQKIIKTIDRLGGTDRMRKAYESLPIKVDIAFIYSKGNNYSNGFASFKYKYFIKHILLHPLISFFRLFERIRYRIKAVTWAIPGMIVLINSKSFYDNQSSILYQLNSWDDGQVIPGYIIGEKFMKLFQYYKKIIKGFILIVPCRHSKNIYDKN